MTGPTNQTTRSALGCTVRVLPGAGPAAAEQAERAVNSALDRRIAASEARVLPHTRGLRWQPDERPAYAGARWCIAWVELDDGEEVIRDG